MGIHTQPSSGARMMFKCSTTLTVLCFLWASMTSIECRRGPSRGALKRIETKIDSFLSTSKIVTIDNQLQLTASGFFTLESCTDFTESVSATHNLIRFNFLFLALFISSFE